MSLTWRRAARAAACVAIAWTTVAATRPAWAQLRIVSYNTLTGENPGTQTARPGISTVLQAIGAQSVGGIAKPIDVLLLQEQFNTAISTQSFVDVLNGLYGLGAYARSTLDAFTSDFERRGGGPALVYNTQTVQLVQELRFGTVSGSAQPRSSMRYRLRPVGYDAAADFYAYNDHYKAGDTQDDKDRRQIEAASVRANANALGQGAHLLFAGDFNIQSSGEQMYQTLLAEGNGQAMDPIGASGTPSSPVTWRDNASYKAIHTQDPAAPMDDRFDFQLVSGEMLDGEGMSTIAGSYRTFGNNGTHTMNSTITTGSGASSTVLSALRDSSDHLPVVADYQIPAKLGVQVAAIPGTVTLGATVSVDVVVQNVAPAFVVTGADELDYTLSVTGDLFGVAGGVDAALGGGNTHQVTLNTATAGAKSGVITVASSSQGAANAVVNFPVSFTVAPGFLAADFNEDSVVDGADLAAWGTHFGLAAGAAKGQGNADLDGDVDGADYLAWQRQVGGAATVDATAVVPEPAALLIVMGAAVMFGVSARRGPSLARRPRGRTRSLATSSRGGTVRCVASPRRSGTVAPCRSTRSR